MIKKKSSAFLKFFALLFALFIVANGVILAIYLLNSNGCSIPILADISWEKVKYRYIELFGGVQRLLDKKQIESFTIFKNDNNRLVSPRKELTNEEIVERINAIVPIIDYLEENQIPYVFLRNILPIETEKDIPSGVEDKSRVNFEKLGYYLLNYKIPVLDLNKEIRKHVDNENLFYRTDHHWSGDASFSAFCIINEYLLNQGIIQPDNKSADISNYERIVFQDTFLGSYGIKVGKYYAGKDNYMFYKPCFDTDVELTAYTEIGNLLVNTRGNWYDVCIDHRILNNEEYNNKYDAMLYGNGGINILKNYNCNNEKKLLLIAHSYGRSLAPYLSLLFSEVRYVDPQPGRFNEDYLKFIRDYQPDYVIFLNEFEGEIIGEYRASN